MITPEAAMSTRWNHSPRSWAKRLLFAEMLGKACASKGIGLEWLDDEKWAGLLRSPGGGHAPILGYDLGLNSSAAAKIADSKRDTYTLLSNQNVSAIPHELLTPHLTDGSKVNVDVLLAQATSAVGLPMVLKPDAAQSGGAGVELCRTRQEVLTYLRGAVDRQQPTATSPYKSFDEYRVIVLNGENRGVIQKQVDPVSGWMHNHGRGAEHSLLSTGHDLYGSIGALGVEGATALDLRFTTVDIAHVYEENYLAILEANDSVSIVYPDDDPLTELALDVYGDAAALRVGCA